MAEYEDMTKDELQAELEDRDLPVSGNKDELVARLELDDAEKETGETEDETTSEDESSETAPEDETDEGPDEDAGKAENTTAVQAEAAEAATPEEIVEAQAKDSSGQRDPEKNPQPNAVAGQPDEDDEDTDDPQHFRGSHLRTESTEESGVRRRIDEEWDEPEPREMGRARTQQDQFDYELLPDGRKRKLIFEEPDEDEDDDQE